MVVTHMFNYLRRTNDMFLMYGSEEELVAKCYVNASFDTVQMTPSHNPGTHL
jgi:hypothetical protein